MPLVNSEVTVSARCATDAALYRLLAITVRRCMTVGAKFDQVFEDVVSSLLRDWMNVDFPIGRNSGSANCLRQEPDLV